jgi:Na+/serine symporter
MKSTPTGGGLFRKYAAVLILLVGGMLLLSSLVSIYFSYQETRRRWSRSSGSRRWRPRAASRSL